MVQEIDRVFFFPVYKFAEVVGVPIDEATYVFV
jgi:hypothetical protein